MVSDTHSSPNGRCVNGQDQFTHMEQWSTTETSLSRLKLSSSSVAGYSGTVFEPIDEFKVILLIMYFTLRPAMETTVSGYSYPMEQ
jgi:hypothetical protein